MTKKAISFLIKLAVTVLILYFLISRTNFDPDNFWIIMKGIDLRFFLFSLVGVIVVLGIKSYRWKILVENEGHAYKTDKAFGAYMASDAIGIVTPGRIGEIARLYYVRQETEIPFINAFKTIVSDRLFDFTMLGWFGTSGLTFYLHTFGDLPGLTYAIIILSIIVAFYLSSIVILGFIEKKGFSKHWQVPGFILASIRAIFSKKAIPMWGLTIVAYAAYFFFSWLIMHSLKVKPGIIDVAFIMSIMSLSTIIPISVAGFGTREATLVILFSYYNLSNETAITFSLLHFTAFFLWGGLIGLIYWLIMPISLNQVKEDSLEIFKLFKPVK